LDVLIPFLCTPLVAALTFSAMLLNPFGGRPRVKVMASFGAALRSTIAFSRAMVVNRFFFPSQCYTPALMAFGMAFW